jgi:uncharacterized protein (DUF305 family)
MGQRRRGVVVVIIIGVIVVGGLVAARVLTSHKQNSGEDAAIVTAAQTSGTFKTFAALHGEAYDKLYLSKMLSSEQVVADLSGVAETGAQHTDLKKFASTASAQAKQNIATLSAWQKQWGYVADTDTADAEATGEDTKQDNAGNVAQLKAQSGDNFDKLYIAQMIDAYQQIVDMSKPGATHADHAEVKKLAGDTYTAGAKDLAQLKRWQKAWGYHE